MIRVGDRVTVDMQKYVDYLCSWRPSSSAAPSQAPMIVHRYHRHRDAVVLGLTTIIGGWGTRELFRVRLEYYSFKLFTESYSYIPLLVGAVLVEQPGRAVEFFTPLEAFVEYVSPVDHFKNRIQTLTVTP